MKFLIYAVILMAMMASVHSWNKIEHKTGKELLHVLEGGYVQRNRAPRLSRNENPQRRKAIEIQTKKKIFKRNPKIWNEEIY